MVEDRAGEVEPLLDVHGIGRVLQRHAHLLGDRHEQIVEDLEHHRIGFCADRGGLDQRLCAHQHEMIFCGEFCRPSRPRQPRSGSASMMMAGPATLWPGLIASRLHDRRLVPLAPFENMTRPLGDGTGSPACFGRRGLLELGAAADGLDLDRLDHQSLGFVDEAEAHLDARPGKPPASASRVPAAHRRSRCRCRHSGYGRGSWTCDIAVQRRPCPATSARVSAGEASAGDRRDRLLRPAVSSGSIERRSSGRADFGEPHAIGREQARRTDAAARS